MKNTTKYLPILVVVIILGFVIYALTRSEKLAPKPPALAEEKHDNQGQQHIAQSQEHVAYNSNPPSSGPHYVQPTPWGIKDSEIADETLVHNLEHGGIIITYQPNLDPAKVNQLRDVFNKLPKSKQFNEIKAVLVPRSKDNHAIQLAAWTWTMNLDDVDEAKIVQFYNEHVDQGPELVP